MPSHSAPSSPPESFLEADADDFSEAMRAALEATREVE